MGVVLNSENKDLSYRSFCVLNSKTGEDKKVADFFDWGLMWSATSALDVQTRLYYTLLAPARIGNPWHLVSVNVDTLKLNPGPIIDESRFCSVCPSSLFFAN